MSELTRGAIVAMAIIMECLPAKEALKAITLGEFQLGNYKRGRFAFRLACIVKLEVPIACKGALGLWRPDAKTKAALRGQGFHLHSDLRGLTLTQPYAALVANEAKKWETRSWKTSYRGQIAIHAGMKFPKEFKALCSKAAFKRHLSES